MNRKVVLVTGAAKGIGAAIVKEFARNGYDVVINYLNSEEKALKLKNDIENTYKVKALTIRADVAKEESVIKMVKEVINCFGRIDCLVNNAAICQDNYFQDKTAEEFRKVLDTNLVGTFLTCKYVGREMLKQKKGRIINISSTNALDTNEPYSMDYDASKSGVISLTRNFALEFAPYILVNAIAPGWVDTESVRVMNPNYLEEEKEKCLLKRFGNVGEIASVAYFLASEESSYINSTVIRVDGGKR